MAETIKTITYHFILSNGTEKTFSIRLRAPSMRIEVSPRAEYPSWTKLAFNQCPNCPLDFAKVEHCPAATSVVDVVEFFKESLSYETVELRITTEAREYSAKKGLQNGLASLVGLHMAASGCPVLDKMRPMVYTHLPFPNLGETMYRALSMYLLAQFLRQKRGKTPDWEMKDLEKIYKDINTVNHHFFQRLLSINPKDANLNAIAGLDSLASYSAFSIKKAQIKELDELFDSYFHD